MKKNYFLLSVILLLAFALFFRLKNLSSSPPSPYWEEVALGYDAYSILETGKDHHGNPWPVVAFESFGDWKPSLYFYALLPFIKLFGLNLLAVRLPSVFAGTFLILGIALFISLLTKDLFKKNQRQLLFLLTLFLAGISPWAITFSRAAWESNLASSLIIWGVNFFLIFINSKQKNFFYPFLAVLFLVLSSYSYHSARLTAPILGLGLVLFYIYKERKNTNWKLLLLLGLSSLILIWPLLISLQSNVGQQRFAQTSIFSDLTVIERSNELKAAAANSSWSKIIYHRYLLFAKEIGKNFLDHFSFSYLFIKGDSNPRHSIQTVGELYLLDLPFLILGLVFILKNWGINFAFLLFFLVIAILPAAMTKTTPHALRTLAAMPVFISLISLGIWQFSNFFRKGFLKKFFLGLVLIVYLFTLTSFWQSLNWHYPSSHSNHWQYGYQQMIAIVEKNKADYEQVYITREQGRPAMYYWFYAQVDPKRVQTWEKIAKKDQGEYLDFEKIKFVDRAEEIGGRALMASSEEIFNNLSKVGNTRQLDEVKNLAGEIVWKIYAIEE